MRVPMLVAAVVFAWSPLGWAQDTGLPGDTSADTGVFDTAAMVDTGDADTDADADADTDADADADTDADADADADTDTDDTDDTDTGSLFDTGASGPTFTAGDLAGEKGGATCDGVGGAGLVVGWIGLLLLAARRRR